MFRPRLPRPLGRLYFARLSAVRPPRHDFYIISAVGKRFMATPPPQVISNRCAYIDLLLTRNTYGTTIQRDHAAAIPPIVRRGNGCARGTFGGDSGRVGQRRI